MQPERHNPPALTPALPWSNSTRFSGQHYHLPPTSSSQFRPPGTSADLRTELAGFLNAYSHTQRVFVRSLQWLSMSGAIEDAVRGDARIPLVETIRPLLLMTGPDDQDDVAAVAQIIWAVSSTRPGSIPEAPGGSSMTPPAPSAEAAAPIQTTPHVQVRSLLRTFDLWRINLVNELSRNVDYVRQIVSEDNATAQVVRQRLYMFEQDNLSEVRDRASTLVGLLFPSQSEEILQTQEQPEEVPRVPLIRTRSMPLALEETSSESSARQRHRGKGRSLSADDPKMFTGPSVLSTEGSSATLTNQPSDVPKCARCGSTTSPLWRSGPHDSKLCNACGLRYLRHKAKFKKKSH
ncbi:hypothetical protein M427DRAFT_142369 [Gonapodya prolifera JEL478]|uniref:GATA-type domain-containing protein n=1 Tax=Gonapodya prolifera (strain JEL478) TaxID=1344416 RepID=A0A139AWZ6_GONPJ|nr:hypothetical protein M427DRAFT_142369 [Gonapodya prolifera JEL478]|eukprot:KXS21224.1 hypothetical protein M427DRAFT_142369 [Gonapodya prolifera JEL478]